MPSLEALATKDARLLRRYMRNAVFVAPISADPVTKMMTTGSQLNALPTGYFCVGHINEDGTEISRDMDSDDTTSDGTLARTRSDRTQDDKSMQVVMQETSLRTAGIYYDIVTTNIAADANGEVKIVHSGIADQLEWRVFRIGYDPKQAVFTGVHFPRATVSDVDSRTIATRTNDEFNATFAANMDDVVGGDMVSFWAAPKAIMQAMGANVAAMTP